MSALQHPLPMIEDIKEQEMKLQTRIRGKRVTAIKLFLNHVNVHLDDGSIVMAKAQLGFHGNPVIDVHPLE